MKKLLALILCAAVLTAVFPFSQTAYAAGGDTDAGMLDEIVIEFFDKSLFPDKEKQYEDEVAKVLKDGLSVVTDNVYVVKAENLSKNPTATLNKYKNSKFIVYAEPNYTIKADAAPNDPGYKSYTAAYNALNAAAGWDIVKSGGPVVAVVDSGTALNPDLPKLLAGYAAVAGLSPNNDKLGHGTGVAGTIGALGNNGIGTVGINWNASIIPVKVDDANGIMSVANVAKGIMWAVDNGAKIINLSLGTTSDSITLKNAIDYAYNKGCALFAATGNESASSLCYPARYANVMAVGSTGNGTTRLSSSNYGPGMGVVALSSYYTTTSAGGYMPMAGTSFATPQAAGLASLIWALNPALTNDQVYSYIQQGAKPLGGGYNEQTGYGLIDIGKTLQLVRDNTQPKVIDTTAPVLTLLGNVIMELKLGENFMEPGYTAIDDTDGNITAKVTVTGAVNVNVAGVYRLEYAVADAAGNTATATRIVEIVYTDDTPPVLTLKGASNMQLRQGDSFVEPGYTAIDNVDGDITNKVVVAGTVDIQTPGEYVLEYKVADAAGNMAAALRVVEVIQLDTTPPVLTLKGASNMEILQGNSFVEPGYTAIDNVDGDISSKVSVSGMVNSEVAEEYALDYRVADAAGNVAFARRVVTVLAKTEEKTYTLPPTLTLFGSPGMQIFCGEDFSEPGYTAYDCLGADLTSAVYIANNVDNEHEGVYTVNYSVEDLGGQTARATRTVTVAERETPPPPTGAPTITIIGSDPIILHLGSDTPYTEQGAYAYDNFEGDLSALVQISGYVDRERAGTYLLTYTVANSAGIQTSATREVRILTPEEITVRTPYSFSSQGKVPTTTTHKGVSIEHAGWMDFSASSVDNKSAISVNIVNTSTGQTVYSNKFTAVGGTQFWVDEGNYNVEVTICEGNGNCKYTVSLLTPEEIYFSFADAEVPLDEWGAILATIPQTGDRGIPFYLILLLAVSLIGILVIVIKRPKKPRSQP